MQTKPDTTAITPNTEEVINIIKLFFPNVYATVHRNKFLYNKTN